jgi:Helix-turn-helix domain
VNYAKGQRGRILALLVNARGGWVPLPEILELGVAQYSARIHELRALGFRIENRRERIDGMLHTYFRLNGGTATVPRPVPSNAELRRGAVLPVSELLFPEAERNHRDDN